MKQGLKIYKIGLEEFEPSKRAEELLEEVREKGKLDQLECVLEELYPDGIGDIELDDLLSYEEEYIRDLIGLDEEEEEEEI